MFSLTLSIHLLVNLHLHGSRFSLTLIVYRCPHRIGSQADVTYLEWRTVKNRIANLEKQKKQQFIHFVSQGVQTFAWYIVESAVRLTSAQHISLANLSKWNLHDFFFFFKLSSSNVEKFPMNVSLKEKLTTGQINGNKEHKSEFETCWYF